MARQSIAIIALTLACSSASVRPGGIGANGGASLAPAELDRMIVESWRRAGVTPSPPASDGEFLRRVTLDLAGRPPTLGETRVFLADAHPDKRARLVDRLLGSPEFGEAWADRYANLLWHEQVKHTNRERDPRAWLVKAFNDNVGYDKISGVILAGRGDVQEHGGLTFITDRLRAAGPEGLTASVARVFLGLQIQCAQCHDHPYDTRWKQQDFWGLVAYFAGTRVRQDEKMMGEKTKDEEKAQKQLYSGMREFRFAFDDDEMGEATSFDGSIPQALMLFNGELSNDGARVGSDGVLGGILRFRQQPADRLGDMMLAAYARKATEREKTLFLDKLPAGDGPAERRAYENLFFALTISTEALTNH